MLRSLSPPRASNSEAIALREDIRARSSPRDRAMTRRQVARRAGARHTLLWNIQSGELHHTAVILLDRRTVIFLNLSAF